jgi:hypothetical protein
MVLGNNQIKASSAMSVMLFVDRRPVAKEANAAEKIKAVGDME